MIGGGPFRLLAGQFTDDSTTALLLGESLIATKRFDPIDQLSRYLNWYREGHLSSTSECFDIGIQTRMMVLKVALFPLLFSSHCSVSCSSLLLSLTRSSHSFSPLFSVPPLSPCYLFLSLPLLFFLLLSRCS
jgi:hypothetical protein